jgi:hypothetical protein
MISTIKLAGDLEVGDRACLRDDPQSIPFMIEKVKRHSFNGQWWVRSLWIVVAAFDDDRRRNLSPNEQVVMVLDRENVVHSSIDS